MDKLQFDIISKDRHFKEMWIVGLFTRCPINDKIIKNCILHNFRKVINLKEFNEYIRTLHDDEINNILLTHFNCEKNECEPILKKVNF